MLDVGGTSDRLWATGRSLGTNRLSPGKRQCFIGRAFSPKREVERGSPRAFDKAV